MTRAGKIWTVVGAVAATVVAGWLLLIAAVYAVGGVMTVKIVDRSEGLDLSLPVPMAVAEAAIASAVAPAVYAAGLPAVHVDGVGIEIGELGPLVLALAEELDELPEVTLVEVVDGRERIAISKEGGKLRVEVEEPGTSIDIAVPTRAFRRVAGRLSG